MAITLVDSNEASATDGGNPSVTVTGAAENDVTIVFVSVPGSDGVDPTVSGYTPIGSVGAGDTNDSFVLAFRKVQTSSPDTSISVTGSGAASHAVNAIQYTLRGVDTSTPEDATTITAQGAGNTQPNNAAIVTVTDGAWVLVAASINVNDAAVTAPTNYVNQVDIGTTDTQANTLMCATREIAAAGSEDPDAWSNVSSATAGAAAQWGALTVAIRPAGAATGQPYGKRLGGVPFVARSGRLNVW